MVSVVSIGAFLTFSNEKNPVFSLYIDLQLSLINLDIYGLTCPAQ